MPTSTSPPRVCSATWIGLPWCSTSRTFGKRVANFDEHRRQHVARLRVGRRDGEHARILAAEFVGDALQVADLAQRAPRGRDDDFAGRRQRRQPLALAHENAQAELVLELSNLLADAGLRGVTALRPHRRH